MSRLLKLQNINQGNESLRFIEKRVADDRYRGSWSSQHNRYTMDQVYKILNLLDKYAPSSQLMRIRNTDITKRPENVPEEYVYAEFCDKAKSVVGIGTQDAMRKNLFVDLHRMGLIKRFNKHKIAIDPFASSNILYVSLSEQGLRFINAKNILDRYFIFSKGLDNLLGGYIEIIFKILEYAGLDRISLYEFMFFVSAINTGTSFNLSYTECVEYIKSFRRLTSIQRRAVIDKMKDVMKPENYAGNKTNKRDFHNWQNKAEQVFFLLGQAVYFDVRSGDKTQGHSVVLKSGINSYREDSEHGVRRLDRSISEKQKYFSKHGVDKTLGFELHHIVPLAWSENRYQFKLLDKWENMVYIDAFSHAKITQNRNRNVIAKPRDEDLILADYRDREVCLVNKTNILYDTEKQSLIITYNQRLRETVQ